LSLVFADSPSGGGKDERSDASERRSFLLQKARSKKTSGPNASVADTSRLLEEAASEANLARALLNVVRNQGAPGVDGQTVEAAEAKADAIILADIGVLDYAARHQPSLRRHLSVQASAANALSISFYRDRFGVKRVVLPRVLSVDDVAMLVKQTGMETEVFAFGSVGPMSEGRCFLSSYMTGLSPTSEGVCAPASHVVYREDGDDMKSCLGCVTLNRFARDEPAPYPTPCKGRYVTRGKSMYLFEEPIGLNAIEILPQLKAAGVTALKIEGRQRSRAYVAEVVGAFRKALDALAEGKGKAFAKDLKNIAEGGRETFGAYKKGWR